MESWRASPSSWKRSLVELEYLSITPRDTTARVYDRMVVMHGLAEASIRTAGTPQVFTLRYTDAWVNRDGRWQMILWQSTRVP